MDPQLLTALKNIDFDEYIPSIHIRNTCKKQLLAKCQPYELNSPSENATNSSVNHNQSAAHSGEKRFTNCTCKNECRCCYNCYECGLKFKQKRGFREHRAKRHSKIEQECHLCNFKATSILQFKYHLLRHSATSFSCANCDFVAPVKNRLIQHMLVHYSEDVFKCHLCNYQTIYRWNVIRHLRDSCPNLYRNNSTNDASHQSMDAMLYESKVL